MFLLFVPQVILFILHLSKNEVGILEYIISNVFFATLLDPFITLFNTYPFEINFKIIRRFCK